MKHIITYVALAAMLVGCTGADRTFECELFRMDYPARFHDVTEEMTPDGMAVGNEYIVALAESFGDDCIFVSRMPDCGSRIEATYEAYKSKPGVKECRLTRILIDGIERPVIRSICSMDDHNVLCYTFQTGGCYLQFTFSMNRYTTLGAHYAEEEAVISSLVFL